MEDQAKEFDGKGFVPIFGELSSKASVYGADKNSRISSSTSKKELSFKRKNTRETFPYLTTLQKPYYSDGSRGLISIRETIELCEIVYANISAYKNVIDIMTEFSSSQIYLEGGSAISKKFITNWLERAKINSFLEQFFREYYRSGNVFIYKFVGTLKESDKKMLKVAFEKKAKIPLRYVILDPKEITLRASSNYNFKNYQKVLSKFEIDLLLKMETEEDREIFNNFPPEIRENLKRGAYNDNGVEIKLDPNRLSAVFYKKQDYEPFATPFGFPVFKDIERKESLKEVDQQIHSYLENVILLITMGDKDGGVNPKALEAMRELFNHNSVGRTLVADWTTKAEFVIPKIGEIIDPKKYAQLNEDIKDGLLNMFVGNEKFNNQAVKAKIFMERLKEGRNVFVEKFLQPEIKLMCETLGFRDCPKVKFVDVDLRDEVQLHRIWLRMVELGILTPEQSFQAMKNGILPESEDLKEAQNGYVEERKKGYYNPLVGGTPLIASKEAQMRYENENETGENETGENETGKDGIGGPNPNAANNGRPALSVASFSFGAQKTARMFCDFENFKEKAKKATKEKYEVGELSMAQAEMVDEICEKIAKNSKPKIWETAFSSFLENPNELPFEKSQAEEIASIAEFHKIDEFTAAMLYHAKCEQSNTM